MLEYNYLFEIKNLEYYEKLLLEPQNIFILKKYDKFNSIILNSYFKNNYFDNNLCYPLFICSFTNYIDELITILEESEELTCMIELNNLRKDYDYYVDYKDKLLYEICFETNNNYSEEVNNYLFSNISYSYLISRN